MHLIIALIVFMALAAIIVWVADWTSISARPTAIDILNRRLARGEIDRAEYDEKRKANWSVSEVEEDWGRLGQWALGGTSRKFWRY
jgi:hypothetical protein